MLVRVWWGHGRRVWLTSCDGVAGEADEVVFLVPSRTETRERARQPVTGPMNDAWIEAEGVPRLEGGVLTISGS